MSAQFVEALRRIEKWFDEFPPTGRFWDDEKTRPMSYGAAYGSNGERDYMRGIASAALAAAEAPTVAQPVAWQWRKRHNAGQYQGEPYMVWSEWEPLVPPYMDARTLAESDPQNYELRPLFTAPPQPVPLTDEQIESLWLHRLDIHDGQLMPQLRDLARAAIAKATGSAA